MFASKEWVKDLLTKVLKRKLNNYSLEEQRIGTWINGKPLYQRTIEFSVPSTGNCVVLTDNSIDLVTNIKGMLQNSSDAWIPDNFAQEAVHFNVWYRNYSKECVVNVTGDSSSQYFNTQGYLTIQYTKTTD